MVLSKHLLLKPENPEASLVLFAGGKGASGLSSLSDRPSIKWEKKNFLMRTRNLFFDNDFQAAVVDVPSDMQSKKGRLGGFRDNPDYMTNRNINIIEKKNFVFFAYHRKASDLCVTFVYTLNNHLYIFMPKK